jgi:hypothetical protein
MSNGQVSPYQTAGSNHYAYPPLRDPKIAVRPLVEKLGQYDRMRAVLEQQGTDRGFWKAMTEVLSEKIVLRSDWFRYAVALTEPEAVKSAVRAIHYDLHLEIRQRSTLIPAYYLCRTKWDYWSEYGLIVEDLYASPGYPFHDERLVKLMQAGHEVYYLRLARMRHSAAAMFKGIASLPRLSQLTDELLYEVGRYIFRAIWHEDQKPALAACGAFSLVRFRQAMELLYLCLSGDLCELRGALTERFFKFFKCVYPQPALGALLHRIQEADGATLAALPQKVRPLYSQLSAAFSSFLKQEVLWREGRSPLPLFKVLFGNLSRLELLPEMLKGDSVLKAAVEKLEKESGAIIGKILE